MSRFSVHLRRFRSPRRLFLARPMPRLPRFCLASLLGHATAVLLLSSPALAGGTRAESLLAAKEQAAASGEPVIALIWGPWMAASAQLHERIWASRGLPGGLDGMPVITAIEVPVLEDEEAKKALVALHGEKWNDPFRNPTEGNVAHRNEFTVPAVYFYGSDGRWLDALEGQELRDLRTAEEFLASINLRLQAVRRSDALWAELARLREGNSAESDPQQAKVLLAILDLPLARPEDFAEQLRRADPQDSSGWVARLEFPGWEFVKECRERAAAGEATTVIAEIQKMLENPSYTDLQRSLLHSAWASALREVPDIPGAMEQLGEATRLDPNGIPGQSAALLAAMLEKYKDNNKK